MTKNNTNIGTPIVVNCLVGCARCGHNHLNLSFRPLLHPCGNLTHWVPCPTNGEPILMQITSNAEGRGEASHHLAAGSAGSACCFCGLSGGSVETSITGTPMHRQCLINAALGNLEASLLPDVPVSGSMNNNVNPIVQHRDTAMITTMLDGPSFLSSHFYKNCKRQRKAKAKICSECPFKEGIEQLEEKLL